jgi:hypothetical protein
MMPEGCCDTHDRMDKKLHVDEYNDFPCGTPTNPHGERRYCCAHCPTQGQPIVVKEEWSDNPLLWRALSVDDHVKVMTLHTERLVRQWRASRKLTT